MGQSGFRALLGLSGLSRKLTFIGFQRGGKYPTDERVSTKLGARSEWEGSSAIAEEGLLIPAGVQSFIEVLMNKIFYDLGALRISRLV